MNIGIIGVGKMGSAILHGLLKNNEASNIFIADARQENLDKIQEDVNKASAQEIAEKCDLGFEGREICEVEKMHLTHPKHPSAKMGILPVEVSWEEGGCVWTFKIRRSRKT